MMSGSYGMGWGTGWSGFGMIPMLLWWVLLAVLAVALVRWLFGTRRAARREPTERALEILAQRYARGEIPKEEFDAKRRDLAA